MVLIFLDGIKQSNYYKVLELKSNFFILWFYLIWFDLILFYSLFYAPLTIIAIGWANESYGDAVVRLGF